MKVLKNNKNNQTDIENTRKMPIKKDGAIYTPSNFSSTDIGQTKKISGINKELYGGPPKTSKPTPKKYATTKKIQPKKTNYAIFLVTTVFVGVIGAVFMFALFFGQLSDAADAPSPPPLAQEPNGTDSTFAALPTSTEESLVIGLVQNISTDARRLDLYLLEEGASRSFFAEGSTDMRNRFGDAMTFLEFRIGDVIELVYAQGSSTMQAVRISAQVVPYHNVRDILVDPVANVLQLANRRYTYTSQTIVHYNNEPISILNIDPIDIASVYVFDGQVVFVNIHQGHGIVEIPHNPYIISGVVEVSNIIHTALAPEGTTQVTIPEGQHRVMIRGTNIEPFEYNVNLQRGQNVSISFDGLVLRAASVIISVEQPYAVVTIDDIVQPANEVMLMEYGEYTLRVELDGFEPFEQQIIIDQPSHSFHIALNEIINIRNVMIVTNPAAARIYIDGTYQGLSPINVSLEYGRYSITFAKEGYMGSNIDLWVNENMGPMFTIQLTPDTTFTPSQNDNDNPYNGLSNDPNNYEDDELPSPVFSN